MKALSIGVWAVLTCGLASAQAPGSSDFAAIDARRNACIARDGSNAHLGACTSVVQLLVDARLNSVYQAWVEALKHPAPDDAKDDAEILQRLVAAERAWIDFRDKDCKLQSTSMLNGSGESNTDGDCIYAATKARVKALETVRSSR